MRLISRFAEQLKQSSSPSDGLYDRLTSERALQERTVNDREHCEMMPPQTDPGIREANAPTIRLRRFALPKCRRRTLPCGLYPTPRFERLGAESTSVTNVDNNAHRMIDLDEGNNTGQRYHGQRIEDVRIPHLSNKGVFA